MQGTSPFALANLGAGAQAGLQSYGAAQDRMANLEEKRYTLMNEAAKADRAEKQAAITFGENSYQHQATLEQKERLGLAELELRREANRLTADYNKARLTSDANLLKYGRFGLEEQKAIEKYTKDKMGNEAIILEGLKKVDPAKLDQKKKDMLKTLLDKEARIQQEAMTKFNTSNLINRGRPGLANTQFKSSDFTVEELPSL
jgi:hypothetical protein